MGKYRQPYTIYKRGKYWYFQTYDANGKRTTPKTTGKRTKIEARQYCDALYLADELTKSDILFNSFACNFFDPEGIYFKDRGKEAAGNTVRQYNKLTRNHLLPYFEGVKIADIDYIKLKNLRVEKNRDYSANTVRSIMNTLNIILTAAYRNDIIKSNPFDKLERFRVEYNTRDTFTLDEVKLLYNNFSPEFKNLVLIMALCGLRISEALALGVGENEIKYHDNIRYIDLKKQLNKNVLIPLKNNCKRPIPITKEIEQIINEGFNTSYFYCYQEFKKIKPLLNMDNRALSFHSLRHFFITNAKSCGVIESKVEFIAGHKIKGMAGVYTNYKIEDLTELLTWQEKTLKEIKSPESNAPEA